MKVVYPVVFSPLDEGGYMAFVPDLEINTQGDDLAEAIHMARDAISLVCVDWEDDGKTLPAPSSDIPHKENDIVSLVDADLAAYRRILEKRTVRRNVSLPSWLDAAAENAGINVSAVLQTALKKELNLDTAAP